MADIANQLQGAVEGLDRFLEALDNSSMKLGSNAAIESKLARAAQKKANQDLRFRKKIEKMEKETAKREAAHLAQLKAMEPFRKKAFTALKQELKAKTDLIKQTKGLGDALNKTGAGLGSMFKALGSGISKAMSGLGKGFKGGIASGLGGIMENLKGINILGVSVGKIFGAMAAGAKTLYEMLATNEKLMADITKQTGIMGDTFRDGYRKQVKETHKILGDYGYTLKETLKLTQDMREAFGDVSYVTDQLVATSAQLQIVYRMSADNANELVEAMSRSGYEAGEFLKTVEKTAITMGADVGMAMRDVAKNTQMLELYAGRGEEYFARMATRAAMLGTDMQSIEDSGKAFEDFDQMSENFGKMGQLFGTGFNDGLKAMTEIRMMYEKGNMLGIQEHITAQVAKTLYYEDGILKSMKTKDVLYQSQIKQMAATMGMDNVSALRAIKAAEMQEMMNTKNFKIEEDMLKTAESKEIFAASQYDYSMAMFSALRDADMKEEDILKKLSEEGKTTAQIIADRKELVSIAEDEMIKRAKIVKEQEQAENNKGALAEKTLAVMTRLDTILANMQKNMEGNAETFGAKLEEQFGHMMDQGENISKGVMDGLTQGFENWDADAGLMDNISNVLKGVMKGGLDGAFGDIGVDETTSITEMFSKGLAAALGGTKGQGLWDLMKIRMEQAWDYGVEKFWELAYWLQDTFNTFSTDIGIAIEDALPRILGGGVSEEEKSQRRELAALENQKRAFERSDEYLAGKGEHESYEGARSWARIQASFGKEVDMPTAPAAMPQFKGADRLAELDRILNDKGEPVILDESGIDTRYVAPQALGWAGGKHNALVGEAGTEVGITRSALRELSSAGIPGYQTGLGGALRNRSGLSQARGGVGGREDAHISSKREQQMYRNSLNNFLRSEDKITQDRHSIWLQDQKEFFVKYPAIVDEAFGAGFRQGGPIVTGIYNSVFSGMQASTRAELAGASKDEQRQLMYQHMTAEGLKPGGLISQGMNWLGEKQSHLNKTFGEGFEKEQEKLDDMRKEESALLIKAGNERKAGNKEANKAAWEQIKLLRVGIETQEHQINELKELQKRGEGWNRATVGLLGGIQSGLASAAGVIASGGSRKQAMEMGKRGAVGGVLQNLAQQLGGGDQGFIDQMNTMGMLMGTMPMPSNIGGNASDIINRAMAQTEQTFQGQGRGLGWAGGNSQGRVYNSPHLAVVGEGSQNEIIVPTERIRKGLPINEGVAKELASIGVPGYSNGYSFGDRFAAGRQAQQYGLGPSFSMGTSGSGGYAGRLGHGYEAMGGGSGMAATGLMSAAQTYMQTGDLGQAAGSALGTGIGMGATVALSAIPGVGPIIGPILGPMIGSFVGGKLGKLFGKKPKYKRYRNRAVKQLEEHVLSNGQFMFGQPGGLQENLERAIAGKKKDKPSEKHYNKLKKKMLSSKTLGFSLTSGNIDSFIALMSGQMDTAAANQQYARFNNLFYGTPMAKGGIVTGPTQAVIGEKGPEAVIPLDQHGGYASKQQQQDQQEMIKELKKQNQQMATFVKNMGDSKTVLNVDGRALAETVGQNMYDINTGM